MDAISRLGLTAERCAVVLGRVDTQEFILHHVGTDDTEAVKQQVQERGFRFLGLIGTLPNGQLAVEVEPGDAEGLAVTIRAIPSYLIPMPFQKRRDDSLEFLRKMWALENPRNDIGPAKT